MRYSLVILNWNGRHHLERFLPSVVTHTAKEKDVTIVVADNGSTDDSLSFLENNFPEVQLVLLDNNYGYAEGYNLALKQIDADCYILMNSDIEVSEDWFPPLREVMESDPYVAALSPKILSYNNKSKFEYAGAAGGFIDYLGYPFCRGRILSAIETDAGQYDDKRQVFWASGACMVVRANAYRELGGFDPDFFAHMEEIDLCWRMQLMGYKIMVEPRSHVYHLGGGTLPNNSPRKLYYNYRNNLAMLYKNLSRNTFIFILLCRYFLDGASALVFIIQGNGNLGKSVYRAHRDFYNSRDNLRVKRTAIQESRIAPHVYGILQGSIILRYMLGFRKFKHLL